MKKNIYPFGVGLFVFLVSCGSVEDRSLGDADSDISPGVETAFLFATDFASSGQLLTSGLEAPVLTQTGVAGLGSSAVVRIFDGLVYILHDAFSVASSDNVQILDPNNQFQTVNQWSTGNGTNPQDIVVIGDMAYISLYNPEQDPTNVDDEGQPADVIGMDLETGEVIHRISFFDFLNDDGARLGHPSAMVLVGGFLYVCLQDLEADFSHNAPGKIGIIHVAEEAGHENHENHGVIALQGRNPVDIAYSPESKKLFVALQAPFDFALGNFDLSLPFGGIEEISLEGDEDHLLVPDEILGGYVERLVMTDDRLFAVVSEMDPVSFSFSSDIVAIADNSGFADGGEIFLTGSSDVREIAADSQGHLWISRRSINATDGSASDPRVDVFDAKTGQQVGASLISPVPVTSIVIGGI